MNMKSLKTQFIGAIAMVLVAAIAMGGSTYAWFAMNNKVTAQTITATAQSSEVLRISTDNTGYSSNVNLGLTVANMIPVSAGTTLIKEGKLFKAADWTDQKDGDTTASDLGKLTATYKIGVARTDYAVADLWFTDNRANTQIFFEDDTKVELKTSVIVSEAAGETKPKVDVYAIYSAKTSAVTTYVLPYTTTTDPNDTATAPTYTNGLIDNGIDTYDDGATYKSVAGAKTKLQNALGALRLTFVPYATTVAETGTQNAADTTASATLEPKFFKLSNSTAGYYNTSDPGQAAGTNVSGDFRLSAMTNKNVTGDTTTTATNTETDNPTLIEAGTKLGDLINADTAQHYKVYCYLEGCDKQCISGIADDVTYVVSLAFTSDNT